MRRKKRRGRKRRPERQVIRNPFISVFNVTCVRVRVRVRVRVCVILRFCLCVCISCVLPFMFFCVFMCVYVFVTVCVRADKPWRKQEENGS